MYHLNYLVTWWIPLRVSRRTHIFQSCPRFWQTKIYWKDSTMVFRRNKNSTWQVKSSPIRKKACKYIKMSWRNICIYIYTHMFMYRYTYKKINTKTLSYGKLLFWIMLTTAKQYCGLILCKDSYLNVPRYISFHIGVRITAWTSSWY